MNCSVAETVSKPKKRWLHILIICELCQSLGECNQNPAIRTKRKLVMRQSEKSNWMRTKKAVCLFIRNLFDFFFFYRTLFYAHHKFIDSVREARTKWWFHRITSATTPNCTRLWLCLCVCVCVCCAEFSIFWNNMLIYSCVFLSCYLLNENIFLISFIFFSLLIFRVSFAIRPHSFCVCGIHHHRSNFSFVATVMFAHTHIHTLTFWHCRKKINFPW